MVGLKAVDTPSDSQVSCLWIPSGNSHVPVPLWNQYNVCWKGVDFKNESPDYTWIVVSNYERWFMQLVDVTTPKSVRQIGKTFMDKFQKEFLAVIASTRKRCDSVFAEEADEEKDVILARTHPSKPMLVLSIAIGGFQVSCLNYIKRVVLKLDKATMIFIVQWIVPLLRQLAANQQGSVSPSAVADNPVGRLAAFHFSGCPTPNIREKVCWSPCQHAWLVSLTKPKSPLKETFSVNPELSAAMYDEEKSAQYLRAIQSWNAMDGSSRHRIPACVAVATGGGH